MGFDFGDTDPAQESPAAGFRLKSIKPSSKEDAGESEQDKYDQENFTAQSRVNGLHVAAGSAQNISAPTGMVFELDPEKQISESNPNNDSEVISNTPVTSEAEAHHQNDEPAEISNEKEHHSEIPAEPISEEQNNEAPEAEEEKAVEEVIEEEEKKEGLKKDEQPQVVAQTVSTPNIPSRLTRPTQVYAVEEKETPVEKKNTDIGFTPASQQVGKTTSDNTPGNSTPEEKAANAEQLPVAANATTNEQSVAAKETVAETAPAQTEPVAEETTIAEQPAEAQQPAAQNKNIVKEEDQPVVEQNIVAAKTEEQSVIVEQPVAQNINAVKEEEQSVVEQNAVTSQINKQPVAQNKTVEQTKEQPAEPIAGNNEIPVQANTEQNVKAETALQPVVPVNTGIVARPKATAQPSVAAEPEQAYQNNQTQDQPLQEAVEEEEFITEEPHVGVNFNTPEPEPALPKKSTRGRKSLKTLDAEASAMNIPEDATLFKRQYYSIGEVAGMFGVNQSLLRFWENEFDIIQPRKNRKGDRHFRPLDIKNLELIYDLLRRRKLTIEGAKEFLKKNKQARERFEMIQSLQQIKGFLLEIKATL